MRLGAKNWSDEEMNSFFEAIEARQEVIFSDPQQTLNRIAIDNAWREVAEECVHKGFIRFANRLPSEIRKDIFYKKRDRLLARLHNSQQAGIRIDWKPWEKVIIRLFRQSEYMSLDLDNDNTIFDETALEENYLNGSSVKDETESMLNRGTPLMGRMQNGGVGEQKPTPSTRRSYLPKFKRSITNASASVAANNTISYNYQEQEYDDVLNERTSLTNEGLRLDNLHKALSVIQKADEMGISITLNLCDGTFLQSQKALETSLQEDQ